MAAGIRQRHGRGCAGQGRCKCPYEAAVYSKRDGRKIRKTFPSLAAAKAWRDDAQGAVRRSQLRAPAPTTVAQAADAWLEGARVGVIRNRSGDVYKPSAIRAYEKALRLRVLPDLGRCKVADITRTDLQDIVDVLVASGLEPSTIGGTMLPVRAIYKRALSRGEVAVNPTSGLEMPAVRGGRDRIASPAEAQALLEALSERDRPIWATAMYAGLRCGELQALRVEDINLAAGVIHVSRGWDQEEGVIATKSGRDRRVPIAAILRKPLAEHLLALGWSDGLVFGSTAVSPFVPSSLRLRARTAWKRAQVGEIGLHECRHTFASLMIAAGVNAKALSSYMGHSSITITLDRYGHLMPGNEDEAADLLDAYLTRAVGAVRVMP